MKKYDSLSYLEHEPVGDPISIFPIPFDFGSDSTEGLARGPRYMLDLGLEDVLEEAGLKTRVLPELPVSKKQLKNAHKKKRDLIGDLRHALTNIRDIVHMEIARGRRIISLGGDHTIAIGTIAGASAALKGDLGVIWIDLHPDAHTLETSISKNPHGMPTMAVMGEGDKRITDIAITPVKKSNFLYLGVRDADRGELNNIRKHKVDYVTMPQIAEHGLKIAYEAVGKKRKKVSNVWISIDLDSIDETTHATSMPSLGGFTRREIIPLITHISRTFNVVGIDIVELAPDKDKEGRAADVAFELMAASFGAKHNWYTRYMNEYGDWYAQ